MATKKASARPNPVAAVDALPDEPAAVLREELLLIREEIADQARRVAFSVALLGGAGVLGLGAFGALTTAAIAALGRPGHRTRRAADGRVLWGRSRSLGRGRCQTAGPGHAGSDRSHPARGQGSREGGGARRLSRDPLLICCRFAERPSDSSAGRQNRCSRRCRGGPESTSRRSGGAALIARVTGALADQEPDRDRQARQDPHHRRQQRGHEKADDPSQQQGHDQPPEPEAAAIGPSSEHVADRRGREPEAPTQPSRTPREHLTSHRRGAPRASRNPSTRPRDALPDAALGPPSCSLRAPPLDARTLCCCSWFTVLLPRFRAHNADRRSSFPNPEPSQPGPATRSQHDLPVMRGTDTLRRGCRRARVLRLIESGA